MSLIVSFDSRPACISSRPMAISRRRIASFSCSAAFSRRSSRRASRTTSLALTYSPDATSRLMNSASSSERLRFIVAISGSPAVPNFGDWQNLSTRGNTGFPSRSAHVKALYMSWTRQTDAGGRRGYHHGNLREAASRAFEVLRRASETLAALVPPEKRPPALMMSLHIWALSHGIASLFARGDAGRRRLPMPPEELLEAGVLVYLRGLGLIAEPQRPSE